MFYHPPHRCTCTETSPAETTLPEPGWAAPLQGTGLLEEELLFSFQVPGAGVLSGLCVMDQSAVVLLQAEVMNFNQLYWLP